MQGQGFSKDRPKKEDGSRFMVLSKDKGPINEDTNKASSSNQIPVQNTTIPQKQNVPEDDGVIGANTSSTPSKGKLVSDLMPIEIVQAQPKGKFPIDMNVEPPMNSSSVPMPLKSDSRIKQNKKRKNQKKIKGPKY